MQDVDPAVLFPKSHPQMLMLSMRPDAANRRLPTGPSNSELVLDATIILAQ